mmetsp:Transcript_13820/g.25901  ORF Transcript_13820/g.25901 Transcript_13820/m.25901 type:complete len:207 (-) Transcript_13820:246-866(-)
MVAEASAPWTLAASWRASPLLRRPRHRSPQPQWQRSCLRRGPAPGRCARYASSGAGQTPPWWSPCPPACHQRAPAGASAKTPQKPSAGARASARLPSLSRTQSAKESLESHPRRSPASSAQPAARAPGLVWTPARPLRSKVSPCQTQPLSGVLQRQCTSGLCSLPAASRSAPCLSPAARTRGSSAVPWGNPSAGSRACAAAGRLAA